MPYPIQNLLQGRGTPSVVRPDDRLTDAIAIMTEKEYSQLPVVDAEERPLGMVTYQSTVEAVSNFTAGIDALRVSHALVKAATFVADDDLFDLLDRLQDRYAVLIVNREKRLIGIVTTYDSTEYFRRRAEDLMLVEDIEGTLKDMIQATFQGPTTANDPSLLEQTIARLTDQRPSLLQRYKQAIKQYLGKISQPELAATVDDGAVNATFDKLSPPTKAKSFEQLSLNDFIELLLHDISWAQVGPTLQLERNAVRTLLDGVRKTRNQLAHFRGELSATQRNQLRFCVRWLQQHQPSFRVDWPQAVATVAPTQRVLREAAVTYTVAPPVPPLATPYQDEVGENEGRYAPLALHLQNQPGEKDRLSLTFAAVEGIIGADLPASARRHRAWWSNDGQGHAHARQWLAAGWRTAQINMPAEQVTFARIREREGAYIQFFSSLLAELEKHSNFPLRKGSPDGQSWLTAAVATGQGLSGLQFVFAFTRGNRFRVELYIDTGIGERNKQIFDQLAAHRATIEGALAGELGWERLDDRRASRIAWYHPGTIDDNAAELTQLRTWAADAMPRFYQIFHERVTAINQD